MKAGGVSIGTRADDPLDIGLNHSVGRSCGEKVILLCVHGVPNESVTHRRCAAALDSSRAGEPGVGHALRHGVCHSPSAAVVRRGELADGRFLLGKLLSAPPATEIIAIVVGYTKVGASFLHSVATYII